MKFSGNTILLFFNDKRKNARAEKILRETFPAEKGNVIKHIDNVSAFQDEFENRHKKNLSFDIFFTIVELSQNIRQQLLKVVNKYQKDYDSIVVTNKASLTQADKDLINTLNAYTIPEFEQTFLFPMLNDIVEKRFNKKQNTLLKKIDSVINIKRDSYLILDDIARIALDGLGLKICTILLVDNKTGMLKIGAVRGMGEYEKEFREKFNIHISDKAVVTECIKERKQIKYQNVLSKESPFRLRHFAEKIGLKSILVTPIFDRRKEGENPQVFATLSFYTKFVHHFQKDELELTRKIADKITIPLSMMGIFENEKEKRKQEIGFIEKVAAEINRNVGNPKKVIEKILNEGIKLLLADRGCIKLCHEDDFIHEYHKKCDKATCDQEKIKYKGNSIVNYVKENRKPLLIPDINDKTFCSSQVKDRGVHSILSVPLLVEEKVIGVLTAEHKEKNYFTENQVKLFETLARHAVIAIENSRRYKELEKRLKSQLIIKKLIKETSKLKAIDDEEKQKAFQKKQLNVIIKRAIEEAGKIFDAHSGFVVLAEFTSNYAKRNPEWQFGLESPPITNLEIGVIKNGKIEFKDGNTCITGKVIAEGKSYNCKKVKDDPLFQKQIPDDKTQSTLIIPLKFQGQTIGAFILNSNKESAFSNGDKEILESIAGQLALLIRHSRYLNVLLDLSKPFKNIDNEEELYHEIVDRTLEALETNVCYIRIIEKGEFVIKSHKGIKKDVHVIQSLKEGEGISGKVAKSFKPKRIENVQVDTFYKYHQFAEDNSLFAMMAVPIITTGPKNKKELIGILNIYANRICKFTSLDLQIAMSIAGKAGESIKKSKLIGRLDGLAKVDREMTSTSEKSVLGDIANIARNILDADQVLMYLYESDTPENQGFPTPPIVAGDFIDNIYKSVSIFTEDSVGVRLIKEKKKQFFIESYKGNNLIKRLYAKGNAPRKRLPYYKREKLKSAIILKLTYQKEVVGILFINYRYSKTFTSEEKDIAKTFASKAAIAISNIRKYEGLERMHNIGNIIATESHIKKVLVKIAANAIAALNADNVILHRYLAKKRETEDPPINRGRFYQPEMMIGEYSKSNVVANLIEGGKDVFAVDVRKNRLFRSQEKWKINGDNRPRFTEREKIQSCAAMLLKVSKKLVGVMFINYRTRQNFTPYKKSITKIFANQAAIAMRNADLFEERERTIKRITGNLNAIQESGYQIFEKLNRKDVSEKDILNPILKQVIQQSDADMGYIGLVDKENRGTKIQVCSTKYKALRRQLIKHYYPDQEWIKRRDRFDIFPGEHEKSDYQKFANKPELLPPDFVFTEDKNVKSALRVPIYSDEELLGMIVLESEKPNAFFRLDAYAVMSLANQASMALQNYKLIQQLRKLREVDAAILKEQDNLHNVLEIILKAALELVKKDYADIKLWDGNKFFIKKSQPPIADRNIIDVNHSLSGVAILERRTVYEKDVKNNPKFLKTKSINTKSELVIPFLVDEEPIGVLNIESERLDDFTEEDIKILEMLSSQAEIAIQYAGLIEGNKNKINRMILNLTAIQESGYQIVERLNRDRVSEQDILNPILTQALKQIDVDRGYIGLVDKENRATKVEVCSQKYRSLKGELINYYYPEKEWNKEHNKFDIFPGEHKESDYTKFAENPALLSKWPKVVFTENKNVKSALRVPIYSDKELLGMIVLESEKPNAFSKLDAYAVMSLANQASMALQNYKLIQQLRKLREVDAAILKEQDNVNNVLEIILKASLDLVKKDFADIKLWDGNTFIIKKSLPPLADSIKIDVQKSISGIAVLERKTQYEKNVSKNPKFCEIIGTETKSELAIPLLVDEEPIGVLNIESERLDDFTEEDIKILEMLASEAAIAIYLAQQSKKLREKEKEASIGYVTRESVHWVGNKIGPISRRVVNLRSRLVQLNEKHVIDDETFRMLLNDLLIIEKGTNSSLSIKSDLIDESKKDDDFDLLELLRESIENFKNEYSTIEIKRGSKIQHFPLKINFIASIKSHQVKGDKNHIGRLVYYMLKNAFQAIEDKLLNPTLPNSVKKDFVGNIGIIVSRSRDNEKLIIDFNDNGIGIKDEDKLKLFRPFHTTKGADRGSGVALYFCKRAMNNHGGEIYMKETVWGKGTTFRLEFPLRIQKKEKQYAYK